MLDRCEYVEVRIRHCATNILCAHHHARRGVFLVSYFISIVQGDVTYTQLCVIQSTRVGGIMGWVNPLCLWQRGWRWVVWCPPFLFIIPG